MPAFATPRGSGPQLARSDDIRSDTLRLTNYLNLQGYLVASTAVLAVGSGSGEEDPVLDRRGQKARSPHDEPARSGSSWHARGSIGRS